MTTTPMALGIHVGKRSIAAAVARISVTMIDRTVGIVFSPCSTHHPVCASMVE